LRKAGLETFFSGIGLINKTSLLLSGASKDKYPNWGYITINNQKTLIYKSKLVKLIEIRKKQALLQVKIWERKNFQDFKILVNGIFQAEGYVGGCFPYTSKYYFTPTISLSQNASNASIDFLCKLWVVWGKNFLFTITKTSQNIYHIRLSRSGWDTIFNLIPYFSYLYGYKYRGFLMLKDMHFLLKSGNLTNETIAKIIIFGYNLVSCVVRKLPHTKRRELVELSKNRIRLNEKFLAVLGKDFFIFCNAKPEVAAAKKKTLRMHRLRRKSEIVIPSRALRPRRHLYSSDTDIEKLYSKKVALHLPRGEVLKTYTENNRSLSMLFILGFFLGDGNFTIRIRDTGKGLWFIPIFRIFQKNVLLNKKLLENIVNFLQELGINSRISAGKENGRLLCLTIEGKEVKAFYALLSEYSKWFFWKKIQFSPLVKYLLLSDVAARHWKNGQLALLREIYSSHAFPYKKHNLEFYQNKLEIYYKNRLVSYKSPKSSISSIANLSEGLIKEDLFYICVSKNISWLVTLPTALKIKPRQKYFFFKTYGDKEKALKAAIEYRDNSLNNWLMNNGFK
jgi:hypothetical protein